MSSEREYIATLQKLDFEQLILEKEDLVGSLFDLEWSIREHACPDSATQQSCYLLEYARSLRRLSVLSQHMSGRTIELAEEWRMHA
ncbi:MAG: hypothetical protein Q4A43_01490 [Coriobacteriia bacterium]|nr:hypothetical protein [Coriobacteriia bacterium]